MPGVLAAIPFVYLVPRYPTFASRDRAVRSQKNFTIRPNRAESRRMHDGGKPGADMIAFEILGAALVILFFAPLIGGRPREG